jgi:hypothetical protein
MAKSEEEKYKGNEKVIKQLNTIKSIEEDIANTKKYAKTQNKETQTSLEKVIEGKQAHLNQERKTLGYFKQQAQEAKKIQDGFIGATKSFARLSSNVRQSLSENKSSGGIYLGLIAQINELEEKKFDISDEQIAQNAENASFAKTITDSLLQQAEATETARAALFGQTKLEQKIEEIEQRRAELGDNLTDKLIHAVHLNETLGLKEERLTAIKETQKELYEAAPESLKSAIDFTKKLGSAMVSGPLVAFLLIGAALVAGLESFKELDKASEDYRKTSGMTVKQTEHLAHQAHEIEVAYRGAGVELKHIFDVSNDLANVFGDMTHFSTATYAALGGIQARTGVTSETAAKVQGVFEQVAGLSGETSANLQQQIASLAQQGKVSPKEVLEDIADNAEATSTFFKGDVTALKNQVIQAHQLGTTLTKVAKTAEELLNFESGIEDELVAATFVGGQFNLSTARGLAYAGKTVEAQEEILNQLNQGIGFKNQDIFAQKALAKAAGMSIEDINKQLLMKEKLAHLTGEDKKNAEAAISAGLDVKDLNDEQLKQKTDEFIQGQKITGQLTDMENSFKGIVATVGGALVPIFTALGPILEVVLEPIKFLASIISEIVNNMYILLPLVATLALYFGTVAAEAAVSAGSMLMGAIGGIFESLSKIPFGLGLIGAGAIVAGMLSMATRAKHVGDLKMPAGEGPTVTTKEGAIYKGTKNDDVAMAPGITSKLDEASKAGKVGAVTPFGGVATSHAIDILVDEMKQMRKDMANKSNDVYMDGSKVTANIASNVSKGTRNNFALGQA